jgi:hypothetical protein
MRILARAVLTLLVVSLAVAPALAGGKELESTPQAKAYRALLKTVDAADYEGYKKGMTAESAKGMDAQTKEMGMEPKKAMLFLKTMSPTEIKITDLKVDGKKATLSATGMSSGERSYGSIQMAEEGGQWKVVKQSWSNKK